MQLVALQGERAADLVHQFLRQRNGLLVTAQLRQHHQKLVATMARDPGRGHHTGLQAQRQLAQQQVAHLVAQGVVDVLEIVQVDEQQGQAALGCPRAGQVLRQVACQLGAVAQAGERVMESLEDDLPLFVDFFGDVAQHQQKHHVPRAVQGHGVEFGHKGPCVCRGDAQLATHALRFAGQAGLLQPFAARLATGFVQQPQQVVPGLPLQCGLVHAQQARCGTVGIGHLPRAVEGQHTVAERAQRGLDLLHARAVRVRPAGAARLRWRVRCGSG